MGVRVGWGWGGCCGHYSSVDSDQSQRVRSNHGLIYTHGSNKANAHNTLIGGQKLPLSPPPVEAVTFSSNAVT